MQATDLDRLYRSFGGVFFDIPIGGVNKIHTQNGENIEGYDIYLDGVLLTEDFYTIVEDTIYFEEPLPKNCRVSIVRPRDEGPFI